MPYPFPTHAECLLRDNIVASAIFNKSSQSSCDRAKCKSDNRISVHHNLQHLNLCTASLFIKIVLAIYRPAVSIVFVTWIARRGFSSSLVSLLFVLLFFSPIPSRTTFPLSPPGYHNLPHHFLVHYERIIIFKSR